MELITNKQPECSLTVDKKVYTARLPRARAQKSDIITLSSGQELSQRDLRPIKEKSSFAFIRQIREEQYVKWP
ncbi:MAG: hypothetical protein LBG12_04705 [Synergistaceae bacterium]|jgi:hypothetical protein|nr:hypothetical protein [Synergistaceae bacterium]